MGEGPTIGISLLDEVSNPKPISARDIAVSLYDGEAPLESADRSDFDVTVKVTGRRAPAEPAA